MKSDIERKHNASGQRYSDELQIATAKKRGRRLKDVTARETEVIARWLQEHSVEYLEPDPQLAVDRQWRRPVRRGANGPDA